MVKYLSSYNESDNKDNFIKGLKDFYFRVLQDLFPNITREEFNKLFDKTIDLELTNNLWQDLTEEEKQQIGRILK